MSTSDKAEVTRQAAFKAPMSAVVVVGCGAVGLPLALAFAERGFAVAAVDASSRRVAALASGGVEADPERLDLRLRALPPGRIAFSAAIPGAATARAFVIAVPTPVDAEGRLVSAPLDAAAGESVSQAAGGDLIVIRSTVPIGATRRLAARFDPHARLLWAACPDRSFAGRALSDQYAIPHLVGGLCEVAGDRATALFGALGTVTRVGSPEAAEATKLFTNVHRDMRFALANQFALICEAAGVDYSEVRSAGAQGGLLTLARPGPAGGPCLTKDSDLLANPDTGLRDISELLLLGRRLNAGLADSIAERVCRDLDIAGSAATVAVLGMAFKATPPVAETLGGFGEALVDALRRRGPGADVRTWDPVSDPPRARAAALSGAAVVVLANEHPDLADLSPLRANCPHAVVYDMCGITRGAGDGGTLRLRVFGDGRA